MSDGEHCAQSPRHRSPRPGAPSAPALVQPSESVARHAQTSARGYDRGDEYDGDGNKLGVHTRLADIQRSIDSMRRTAGALEARIVDLECSVGRIHSAFGQMADLHGLVVGASSRSAAGHAERGGRGGMGARRGRDDYNRAGPRNGEHTPPGQFGNSFGGGRGRQGGAPGGPVRRN